MIKLLNIISAITGKLVWLKLPPPLSGWSIRVFCSIFHIDTAEAEKDIESYQSIGEYFSRKLKPHSRAITGNCVSPIDGTLRDLGTVSSRWLPQIKGKRYSLPEFLGSDKDASRYQGGTYLHFYLSPQDYHRIHFPVRGKILRSLHFPGTLWPVNNWSWSSISNLFVKNERYVSYIESEFGLVALIMIGALNVGGMQILADSELHEAGDEFGMFMMGSAVVLLFERDIILPEDFDPDKKGKILMGESLLREK